MQVDQCMSFKLPVEGDLFEEVKAIHYDDVSPETLSRVKFFTGDASKLEQMQSAGTIGKYDGVIMSNLLCRLPDPMACLDGLASVVNMGGVVLLVTPFSWLTEFTSRTNWLGGYLDPASEDPVLSKTVLKEAMESRGFEKIHEEEMPVVIREHQRKYQYIISMATGWRKIG